jgi:hypothetical protein
MAASIPIAILSATEDYFDLNGAKEAYNELKNAYTILGIPDKVKHVIAEGKHGWQKSFREEAVRWCKKWLMNDDSKVIEPDDIGFFENEKDCWVTKTGQVLTNYENEKSVADLVRERLEKCKIKRENFLTSNTTRKIVDQVKKLIGFETPSKNPKYILVGEIDEANYKVEKYLLLRDSQYEFYLPALLFTPKNKSDVSNAVVIVSENGKIDELKDDGQINSELMKGNIVLAVDVCKTGELKDKRSERYDNKEFWIAKLPLYEGKTLLAYRAEDILIAKNFLKNKINAKKINLISIGYTGPAAFHAALFDRHFNNLTIINSISNWQNFASSNHSSNQIGNIIPNVLNYYDLPDLKKLVPEMKINFIGQNNF